MMVIISGGKTPFHICYNKNAPEGIRFAATELQKYLYRSTKTLIPLFSDRCPRTGPEIHLGTEVRKKNYISLTEGLSDEGFHIGTFGEDFLFVSRSPRGVLYAVYAFLRETIGFYAPDGDTTVFDYQDTVVFGSDVKHDLPFVYRECYFTDAFRASFAAPNFLNGNLCDLSDRYGSKDKWYDFHHSFSDLIDPNLYFEEHPEYFSEIDGIRRKEHTELCLSNEDVFQTVLKKLRERIKNNPNCHIFSIAQDEWLGHSEKMACECPRCRAFDEKHGSKSASVVNFVNRIAEALEEDHPDILIHTFAYQYSRKPPKGLKVHKNVIIRLCNIECSWGEGIESSSSAENIAFLEDLLGWSKLTDRLYIWDYAVNFRNYLLPFPCFQSMTANIGLYKKVGVKGLLMQGNFSAGGKGYFDELKAFVAAGLMRGDEDPEKLIDIFCKHYYGKAKDTVKEYLYHFENAVKGKKLRIYDDADAELFTDEVVEKAREIMDRAKKKVSGEREEIRLHVDVLDTGLRYLEIVRMPLDAPGRNEKTDCFEKDIRRLGITELFERTNLDCSLKVMRESRYAKERPEGCFLYYIMR